MTSTSGAAVVIGLVSMLSLTPRAIAAVGVC
jgi:hypothetical protein